MEEFFGAPPEGAIPTEWPKMQTVEYAAMKTPGTWVPQLNAAIMASNMENRKLGFHYYDREARQGYSLRKLSFVVLESYSQITGAIKIGDQWQNYWSNRVKDSRVSEFAVFNGGHGPAFKGLYTSIKDRLPQGVGFHVHLICYCFEVDGLVEIKMTSLVQRGIQRAMANSMEATGKGRPKDYSKISMFSISENDLFWGFRFMDFAREDAKGNEYPGTGDLYFTPVFTGGIVHPNGNTLALHRRCCEYQNELRAAYRSQVAKYGGGQPAQQTAPEVPAYTNISQPEAAVWPPEAQVQTTAQASPWPESVSNPYPGGDDLPF